MGALFNFILVVFIIVVAFRIFFLNILPWILKRKIQKMQDAFNQQQAPKDSRREGELHFDKSSNKTKSVGKDDVGEYVDYEEVD